MNTLSTEYPAYTALPPYAKSIVNFVQKNGSISAREAVLDLDMHQGSLTKGVSLIRKAGYLVRTESRFNPVTGRPYTRYYVEAPVLENQGDAA